MEKRRRKRRRKTKTILKINKQKCKDLPKRQKQDSRLRGRMMMGLEISFKLMEATKMVLVSMQKLAVTDQMRVMLLRVRMIMMKRGMACLRSKIKSISVTIKVTLQRRQVLLVTKRTQAGVQIRHVKTTQLVRQKINPGHKLPSIMIKLISQMVRKMLLQSNKNNQQRH